jgi:hypothetical protein
MGSPRRKPGTRNPQPRCPASRADTQPRIVRLTAALAVTVALGLVSRLRPIGIYLYDKSLGDALYAVAAYLALALARPRMAPVKVALLSLAFCLGIELFQLTGIPARVAHVTPLRWLLGTHFSLHDAACYPLGIALILALDLAWHGPTRSSVDHNNPTP